MARVTFYYKKTDPQIDDIKKRIIEMAEKYGFSVIDICLDEENDLAEFYNDATPSLQIGPYRLKYPFDEKDIDVAFSAYVERNANNPAYEEAIRANELKLLRISPLEKFSYWLSNNYALFITGVLVLFLGFPFLAPVLMKGGDPGGANVIYKVYSVFCHQLAYRSFFLFGEQGVYPRELAHVQNVLSYEQATGKSALDTEFARGFIGNEVLGYKIAICERDIAIYGSLILGGLIFQLSRRRIKSLPWYLWAILAVLPIAIDGSSQLFSLGGTWPAWFPIRESTPWLRVITGTLFGLGTAWYVFPMMEENLIATRAAMSRKMAIKRRLIKAEMQK